MLIEATCVLSIIFFSMVLIKEKKLIYPIFFVLSFFAAAYIESSGVANSNWSYSNVMMPFGYLVFGLPVAILIIYGVAGSLIPFMTAYIKKKRNEKIDKKVAYISIIVGVICLPLSLLGLHLYIAYSFLVFGVYLIVKEPSMFYVGAMGLVADLFIEHIYIFTGQLTYTESYGDVGVAFFLVGSILSGLVILFNKKRK